MKKTNIRLCWYIPVALVGLLIFLLTLWAVLEIGGAYYIEYAIAFMLSFGIFGFGAVNIYLELYNDYYSEKEKGE